PLRRHTDSGLLALTPKKFSDGSDRCAESLAPRNQLRGNSSLQSVMYLPPNTPSRSISAGVSSGRNSGAGASTLLKQYEARGSCECPGIRGEVVGVIHPFDPISNRAKEFARRTTAHRVRAPFFSCASASEHG